MSMNITATFQSNFQNHPKLIVRAPGRVNLLGEHIDYNQGPVLPVAIDRAIYLAANPTLHDNKDKRICYLYACDFDQSTAFSLDNLELKLDILGNPLPNWAYYPAGVAWALQQAGFDLKGAEIAYQSDIPMGSGLSSSAATQIAFAVLWQTLGGWTCDRLDLARLCQKAENEYVGVSSGLMDQFASACGVQGHALFFDTQSLAWEAVPLFPGSVIVIADSGVRRNLSKTPYNERREACEQAVSILRKYLPHIQSLRDVKTTEFAALRYYLPESIQHRAEHVVKEIQRVFSAHSALLRQDKQAMGALMYAGHKSLRDLYEVSTPELDLLVSLTRNIPGTIGSRLTGAGFGGCTVSLVEQEFVDTFIEELGQQYFKATGIRARIFQSQASQGASIIEV